MKPTITLLSLCAALPALPLNSWATDSKADSQATEQTATLATCTLALKLKPFLDHETGKEVSPSQEAIQNTKQVLKNELIHAGITSFKINTREPLIKVTLKDTSRAKVAQFKQNITQPVGLTLHRRHPQSNQLAQKVFEGTESVPGYSAFPQEIKNEAGEVTDTRYLLVTSRPAISPNDLKSAYPDRATNSLVFIELTEMGAQKMIKFTSSLTAGKDHIVSIIGGKVMNSAVLNANVLAKNFVISGLNDINECESISRAISSQRKHEIEIVSDSAISQQLQKQTLK